MLRRLLLTFILGTGLCLPLTAHGQGIMAGSGGGTTRIPGVYAAPGFYGTTWGTPSYGSVRTYSEFASPYGGGYGRGYPPSTFLPGPLGVGLWRPDIAKTAGGVAAARGSYRTFAVPYSTSSTAFVPPFGVYAPAFGPSVNYGSAAFEGW